MSVRAKLSEAAKLIRLTRQYGTCLVMIPALWSLVLAGKGKVPVWTILVFVAGSFMMRSAGVVINDIADRHFDPHVERTKNRPLAAGTIRLREAVAIFLFLVFVAVCLAFVLNRLAIMMSAIGLVLASVYPFTKRYFRAPQVFLGLAFGWGVIVAWAAVANTIGLTALLLFLSTVFWVTAYDTIYGLVDKDDDVKIGIKSAAILFGRFTWQWVAGLYALSVLTLAIVGWVQKLGPFYYFAVAAAVVVLAGQVYCVKNATNPKTTFRAFESNVFVGLLVLIGMIAR